MKQDLKVIDAGNHYNFAPLGWREITPKEFAETHLFFSYAPESVETRHICYEYDERGELRSIPAQNAQMFHFYNGTGYALVHEWQRGGWVVRYFKFGCEHDFAELSPAEAKAEGVEHWGKFCHVYKCRKCGFVEVQDSSG